MGKKVLAGLATAGMLALGAAGLASAAVIEDVQLTFASGAVWEGTITFNDGFEGMIATDGYLNGGSYNFVNEYFSWTWWEVTSSGTVNPFDYNSDGLYEDWLMNGSDESGYTMFIGLSWDETASILNGGISFSLLSDPFYSGNLQYNDLLVSASTNAVPEPSTMLLLGSGLLGVVALNRRRNA